MIKSAIADLKAKLKRTSRKVMAMLMVMTMTITKERKMRIRIITGLMLGMQTRATAITSTRNSRRAELHHLHQHAQLVGKTKGDATKMPRRTTEIKITDQSSIEAGSTLLMTMKMTMDRCELSEGEEKPWQRYMILSKSDEGSFENIMLEVNDKRPLKRIQSA